MDSPPATGAPYQEAWTWACSCVYRMSSFVRSTCKRVLSKRTLSEAEVSHLLRVARAGLEGRPEAANLVGIYAALAGVTSASVLQEFGGRGFGDFKPALADLAVEKMLPIPGEMNRLMADPANIDAILADGADRAGAIAEPILREINGIVGLISAS